MCKRVLRWVTRRNEMGEELKLGTPWAIYAARVEALFAGDEAVHVDYDGEAMRLILRVDGAAKAEAIERILPQEMRYGNVVLGIEVVPSNHGKTDAECFRAAFDGNPALRDVADGYGPMGDIAFALFAPETVQLREDDISEFGGVTTITVAELAESVLKQGDVLISSALKE